jgi:hypothetical protein
MDKAVKQPFSMLTRTCLTQQHIMSLVHLALFWTHDYNLGLQVLQSGNQDHDSVYMWAILHHTLDQLLWSLILAWDTFPHNFMWYLMISFQQYHTWKRVKFYPTGLILWKTQMRE